MWPVTRPRRGNPVRASTPAWLGRRSALQRRAESDHPRRVSRETRSRGRSYPTAHSCAGCGYDDDDAAGDGGDVVVDGCC